MTKSKNAGIRGTDTPATAAFLNALAAIAHEQKRGTRAGAEPINEQSGNREANADD